jgi:hypothetical protein
MQKLLRPLESIFSYDEFKIPFNDKFWSFYLLFHEVVKVHHCQIYSSFDVFFDQLFESRHTLYIVTMMIQKVPRFFFWTCIPSLKTLEVINNDEVVNQDKRQDGHRIYNN